MADRVSVRIAEHDARREHSGKVKSLGFEEREIGPHTVNVFYYSVNHKNEDIEFTEYRAAIYVDSKRSAGVSF